MHISDSDRLIVVEVIYNGDMKQLLKDFLAEGFTPEISTQSGVTLNRLLLRNLKYKNCEIHLVIKIPVTIQGVTEYKITGIEEYIEYKTFQQELEGLLINKRNLSTL